VRAKAASGAAAPDAGALDTAAPDVGEGKTAARPSCRTPRPTVAGVLKNALEWVVASGELCGKPVALLSAGTSGGVFARRDLVRTLSWRVGAR
jgi:NADPH-dependent FMN reductase